MKVEEKMRGVGGGQAANGRSRRRRRRRNGEDEAEEEMMRKRTTRRVQASSTTIQRLFVACRTAFKGPGTVPHPDDVHVLRLLLDKMRPEDVGLSSDLLFFKSRNAVNRAPRITYSTVYKCNNFSMCIFFLPPTAVIPLHNHPGMTVFSKLLVGSMHIKSYDWVDPVIISTDSKPSSQLRLAKLVVDSEFTAPCNTCILYPTSGGNMHTFRAMTPCAVLDVLGPPYSKEDDRDCTYYHDHPYSSFSDYDSAQQGKYDHLRWLEEIDIPKNLKMDGVEYLGPQILDD
ncbi:plant cysteine oxidase 2 isoform X2 [Elaeis guineensis]|uniref:cysteine dioxygenase n=1 Tax=Elaeis guineensis var. tenera TaxID=51953 RepID=A0A6I9RFL6_ELAGV|nr:plant cysteine oxidase 2 [Elaeis guineensis]